MKTSDIQSRLLALLAGLVSNTHAASGVTDLAAASFDDFVNAHQVVLVEFFAPWCKVCQELAPIYEATGEALDPTKNIRFARVDCVESPDLCQKYRTPIYPTIRVFKGADEQEIYNGPRTPEEMTLFVERRYRPLVATLTSNTIEEFKKIDQVTVVGYFNADDAVSNATFSDIANSNIDYYAFGAVNDLAAASAEGLEQPAMVLYKQFDEGRVVFNGPFEEEAIDLFLDAASTPLVTEFNKKYAYRYDTEGTLPFVGIFAETIEERNTLNDMIRAIAAKHKDTLRFASIDVKEYKKLAMRFGVDTVQSPILAIKQRDGEKYHFDHSAELKYDAVEKWIDDYVGGKLEPYYKAEPAPATQEGPVTVVVRDTFQDLVLDTTEDVLLEFYAPWCGHCKKLAPIYEHLAEIYNAHAPTIRVAKIDGSANEIPGHPVGSYPTIYFFPAADKTAAVKYEGNRTIGDLAEFVRLNSIGKADISAILEQENNKIETVVSEEKVVIDVKDEL